MITLQFFINVLSVVGIFALALLTNMNLELITKIDRYQQGHSHVDPNLLSIHAHEELYHPESHAGIPQGVPTGE